MNHLYSIKFTVSDKSDFFEELRHKALAYVLAECPYQAMFFVRNKLLGGKWSSNKNENIEKIEPLQYKSLKAITQKNNREFNSKDVILNINHKPQSCVLN
jgi:hypothetical protein